ncbi:MAG: FAD-dependent monooxygenase [Gammaproteobacteria bacterium]|nr:2-octaprenyl-6-methoxyphenyl hydroxylase [Rhodocyclaceae bacterium]MBU3910571.1 FAD-dependent monooxygenase [Gammaproteobacteria bacterium]MBU3988172.1 FAD-dependent monooxygenase [Gammaproteobacteria bacterium]MBU4005052.1 FAD-dependent monooxygenase [Gammaproteobacteria bacterium]MBU4020645.1 FAD-dependent monooxygenase [Gammaproteobacteria bacterium]
MPDASAASLSSRPLPQEGGRRDGGLEIGNTDDGNRKVAIIGGGPAGMALALALHQQGINSDIFDARTRGAAKNDKRILALSYGTRQILERLGVWNGIPATAIDAIHISQRGRLGRTRLTARAEGVPALGYVLNAGDLAAALDTAVAQAGIPYQEKRKVGVGDTAQYALTAWAEGVVADDAATVRDYDQLAVLCTATTHEPHHHTAWERFTPDGPLALLPYGIDKGNQYAVVFTCSTADATQLAAQGDADFLARLQNQFGTRLTFTAVGPRISYALGLRYRENIVAERQVWIGNAAQTLHPVAGQGFNLALRDIWDLAQALGDPACAGDPGNATALANYVACRRLDRHATIRFTDGLTRLFSNDFPPLAHARGAALLALDLLPPLRSFVARRMMFGARAW